ncbi:methyltransferase family protein [Lentzea sp. HUAS TT2]|uniref:methyltransferase family protein n=1 Tax=Lentzea sp. HUAS TT2 TaxID=3447454 RepID=UPI003F6F5FC5
MKGLLRNRFPAAAFVVGIVGLTVGLVRAVLDSAHPTYPLGAVLLALYLAWVLLEVPITLRTAASASSEDDRGSEQIYGVARLVTMLTAALGPVPWSSWQPWLVLSPLFLLCGVALRLTSIHALGRFYSHRVRLVDDHQIVTTGPYRLVRHPSYTGMLLANAGLVLYFANPVSVMAFALLFVPAVVNRILVEERAMFTVPGYHEFALGRKRLAPFVW